MPFSISFLREPPAPAVALPALLLGPVPALGLYYGYVPAGTHVGDGLPILGSLLGAAYAAAMIWLSLRVLRSEETRVWFGVVIMLGCVVTGHLPLAVANMRFDQSPPLAYTARVLESHPRGKRAARITVTHWDPAAPPFTMPGMLLAGEELPLVVHQGWLGFAWIEGPEDVRANGR
ncbi:MAG TPA: hypothetical protein VGE07_06500 [Herpetosiphonaceae bacterium]